jgi:hypothetical protein
MRTRVAVGSLVLALGALGPTAASAKDPPTTTTVQVTTTPPSAPPVGEFRFLASSHHPEGNAASAGGRCPLSPDPDRPYHVNARFNDQTFVEPLSSEGGDWEFHSARVPPEVTEIKFTAACNMVAEDGTLVPTTTFAKVFAYPPPRPRPAVPPTPPLPAPPAQPAPPLSARPRFTG